MSLSVACDAYLTLYSIAPRNPTLILKQMRRLRQGIGKSEDTTSMLRSFECDSRTENMLGENGKDKNENKFNMNLNTKMTASIVYRR
jgi:hypothetical protein